MMRNENKQKSHGQHRVNIKQNRIRLNYIEYIHYLIFDFGVDLFEEFDIFTMNSLWNFKNINIIENMR